MQFLYIIIISSKIELSYIVVIYSENKKHGLLLLSLDDIPVHNILKKVYFHYYYI